MNHPLGSKQHPSTQVLICGYFTVDGTRAPKFGGLEGTHTKDYKRYLWVCVIYSEITV